VAADFDTVATRDRPARDVGNNAAGAESDCGARRTLRLDQPGIGEAAGAAENNGTVPASDDASAGFVTDAAAGTEFQGVDVGPAGLEQAGVVDRPHQRRQKVERDAARGVDGAGVRDGERIVDGVGKRDAIVELTLMVPAMFAPVTPRRG
jgi:hypothetical protein